MKMSSLILKSLVALILITTISSCSRDVLVTRKEIRNLNLVKVGAPDREIPEPVAPSKTVAEKLIHRHTYPVLNEEIAVSDDLQEYLEEAIQPTQEEDIVTTSTVSGKTGISQAIPLNISERSTKAAKKIANILENQIDHVIPYQNTVENKEPKDTSVNILRLLLYILLALLVIAILGIILPKFIVTIIVLVLLIAGILYLLGEI